jgi:hypothetical protein
VIGTPAQLHEKEGNVMKSKYLNLALAICLAFGSLSIASPASAQTTVFPPEWFWNEPAVPSIFDVVAFGLQDYPPPEWNCVWDFGDGTTSETQCWFVQYKQYTADGDYTVSVQVTNENAETTSITQTVSVRTHDVAITRFTVPQSAKAGQTRQLTVYVRNTRYPEKVQVELYKNDMVWIGTLTQNILPRSAYRTTAFNFSYTFTPDDARIGKVTFKAQTFIIDICDVTVEECDDWRVDNYVTALPTRVSR